VKMNAYTIMQFSQWVARGFPLFETNFQYPGWLRDDDVMMIVIGDDDDDQGAGDRYLKRTN